MEFLTNFMLIMAAMAVVFKWIVAGIIFKTDESDESDLTLVWFLFFIVVSVVIAAFLTNFSDQNISKSVEQWGQMGDYFGGMLNPILAFASFMALLYTIRIQSNSQSEISKNYKQDRAMTLLVPEYHRYANTLTLLLDKADEISKIEFEFDVMSDKSLEQIVRNIMGEQFPEPPRTRVTLSQVADAINFDYSRDEKIKEKATEFLVCMKDICVLSGKMDVFRSEIVKLADNNFPLFDDGSSRIAKHLLTAEILCRVNFLFSVLGIKSLLAITPEFVSKEFERHVESAYGLDIDTPTN